jgi:hypothetical protein
MTAYLLASCRSRRRNEGQGMRDRMIERWLNNLDAKGYIIGKTKGGHWSVEHPKHPKRRVIAPATSSDHRSFLNSRAQVRRTLPTPELRAR